MEAGVYRLMNARISRHLRLALGGVGCLLCVYMLGTALAAQRMTGISRYERMLDVEWLAADHPAQYWTVLLLMALGAIAFGRAAWAAWFE
jgi:hypothetical protein